MLGPRAATEATEEYGKKQWRGKFHVGSERPPIRFGKTIHTSARPTLLPFIARCGLYAAV